MENLIPEYGLSGRVALVTGASRGIGLAVGMALGRAGARLALVAQSNAVFAAARQIQAATGAEVVAYRTDISAFEDIAQVVSQVLESFGQIDILVNDAAVMGPTGAMVDNDPQQWARAIQVNVVGPFNVMKCALPGMQRRNSGTIINFSGGGAASPSPNFSAYGCSKAAVVRLTETLAEELKDTAIRVNVIAPGANDTDMLKQFLGAGGKARTVVTMDKPVNLVMFLASDRSIGISGKFIHVYDDYPHFTAGMLAGDLFTLRRVEP